ncbi:MAG TPA: ABC transporter ATP-binding protein [Bacillota bacterium]|nr:ABC transporter ATP-binding protein [Bacillota bacterium]
MSDIVMQVSNLKTHFFTSEGEIPAVDDVSLKIHKGEIVGVVGESGSGKSVTSLSIMQLLPERIGKIVAGEILFNGQDLTQASKKQMQKIRGKKISMIFQEPMTSLDPLFTIGNQLIEAILNHERMNKQQAREKSIELLKLVGIPRAESIVDEYPHQLSGGMRQRVMIAMAMSCDPDLLIADEPTTALDVTIQAQILDVMRRINEETNMAILFITHDLGVVAEMCDRVVVMYAGQVVEEGTVREILKEPKHPYTKGLIRSLPKLEEKQEELYSIPGTVPVPKVGQVGCKFAPRCEYAFEQCFTQSPELYTLEEGRSSRCFLHVKEEGDERDDTTANLRS